MRLICDAVSTVILASYKYVVFPIYIYIYIYIYISSLKILSKISDIFLFLWLVLFNILYMYTSKQRLYQYCCMDAPHGRWVCVWRESLTLIAQKFCKLYCTSPGDRISQNSSCTATYLPSLKDLDGLDFVGFSKSPLEISHDFFIRRCRFNILRNIGSTVIDIITKSKGFFYMVYKHMCECV